MPRYFFNIGSHTSDEDHEGTVLADANAARIQGVVFAGDYLRDNPDLVRGGSHFNVAVVDEAGTVLLKVVVTADEPGASP
jgi:hypothetical protein